MGQFLMDAGTAVAYGWTMTAGWKYVFRPWKSPLLRWRLHTVYGVDEKRIDRKLFLKLLYEDREQVWAFAKWVREMKTLRSHQ